MHDAELVHRDIKPSNMFVDTAHDTAKLGDFGLVRILNDDTVTLTRVADLVGTPAYMSPEQTVPGRDVTALADVYGLGATLYQILTTQPPFRGSSLAILKQIHDEQPLPPRQLNESVSMELETICLKALDKEPPRRYQSAAELAKDLQAPRRPADRGPPNLAFRESPALGEIQPRPRNFNRAVVSDIADRHNRQYHDVAASRRGGSESPE